MTQAEVNRIAARAANIFGVDISEYDGASLMNILSELAFHEHQINWASFSDADLEMLAEVC